MGTPAKYRLAAPLGDDVELHAAELDRVALAHTEPLVDDRRSWAVEQILRIARRAHAAGNSADDVDVLGIRRERGRAHYGHWIGPGHAGSRPHLVDAGSWEADRCRERPDGSLRHQPPVGAERSDRARDLVVEARPNTREQQGER